MRQYSKNNKTRSQVLKTAYIRSVLFIVLFSLILLSCIRCANMQRPTGGPKDSLPPELLEEIPENYTRNFKEKEIVLTFDEFIKLNNQMKEFSISPDLDEMVNYRVRKKRLIITLPDSLEENTTYTINFGKGLVDYNEGNPVINYNYVFATGDELDSLSISGSVKNGFTKAFDPKKDENIKILLIPTRQDTIFGKRKANIFVNVDTSGNFKFNNLREDTYQIYALKEQNNDRIYNGNDEWIGFREDSIILNKDITGINLELTKGYPKDYRTLDKRVENTGYVFLTFAKPIQEPTVEILQPQTLNDNKIERYNFNRDTAKIYFDNTELDSIKLLVREADEIIDTVSIRVSRNMKFDRDIKPQLNITNKVDRVKHIELSAASPLASVDKSKILIYEDSVSRRNFQLQQDSLHTEMYHIRFNWRPKRNYELVIQEGAMQSPFGDTNKEYKTQFTYEESDNYGNIHFDFHGLDSTMHYVVELIDDSKEKVFDRRTLRASDPKLSYTNYPGGKYSLRVIYDENNNGRWDPADIYAKKQAENIWYLDKTFTIRANWDQNETINLP